MAIRQITEITPATAGAAKRLRTKGDHPASQKELDRMAENASGYGPVPALSGRAVTRRDITWLRI